MGIKKLLFTMAVCVTGLSLLFGCAKSKGNAEIQEGQIPLKLLFAELYIDEDWPLKESAIEAMYASAIINNQIQLTANAMVLETEEDFWDWSEKDCTAFIDQKTNAPNQNLRISSVHHNKTSINSFPAYYLTYKNNDKTVQYDEYWIYVNQNVVTANWYSLHEQTENDLVITKEEWELFLETLHVPNS